MDYKIGSLFSGIGGLELGLERAGLGRVIWQVERDAYCRAVLAQHWPEAERFEDVNQVGAGNLRSVDLVCGGFPCQDVSSAGKRAGLAGARSGLWYAFARVVAELDPEWVVVENVASGAKLWVDVVCGDLEQLGYAPLPIPIGAADVGASHRRNRIFVVAHSSAQPPRGFERSNGAVHYADLDAQPNTREWLAEVPADAHGPELRLEQGRGRREDGTGAEVPSWAGGGFVEPNMVRVVHGVSRRVDSPSRRIAALGNSVVPQCAEVIGHVIKQLR